MCGMYAVKSLSERLYILCSAQGSCNLFTIQVFIDSTIKSYCASGASTNILSD